MGNWVSCDKMVDARESLERERLKREAPRDGKINELDRSGQDDSLRTMSLGVMRSIIPHGLIPRQYHETTECFKALRRKRISTYMFVLTARRILFDVLYHH